MCVGLVRVLGEKATDKLQLLATQWTAMGLPLMVKLMTAAVAKQQLNQPESLPLVGLLYKPLNTVLIFHTTNRSNSLLLLSL